MLDELLAYFAAGEGEWTDWLWKPGQLVLWDQGLPPPRLGLALRRFLVQCGRFSRPRWLLWL